MPRQSPQLAGDPDPPLYTGDIEADIRGMNNRRAEELGGCLSYPSKMGVAAWGIPAAALLDQRRARQSGSLQEQRANATRRNNRAGSLLLSAVRGAEWTVQFS